MSTAVISDTFLAKLLSAPLDGPGKVTRYTGDQLFLIDPRELEQAQLAMLRRRFAELTPKLPALKKLADENRITELNSIDEVVPVLFPHTMHKSYPMSLIANGRFDLMNAWLNDFTVHDLLGLDISKAQTIDDWLDIVEAHTPVRVMVSSGTSGKCTLLPKSTYEFGYYTSAFAGGSVSFRDEPGLDDFCGQNRYQIMPRARYTRHSPGYIIQSWVDAYDGDDSHAYSLGGEVSTDMLWLTGQMRKAQADGTFEQLKRTVVWKRVNARLAEQQDRNNAPMSAAEFAKKVLIELKGKSVCGILGNSFLWSLVDAADKHGLEIDFASNSLVFLAGGAKLDTTTPEQRAQIKARVPIQTSEMYGFGELAQFHRKCSHGHFHAPPWVVHFILDRDTGEPYPRKGTCTGRYAAFDLWAESYWAGFITGDEATMNWDGGCPCGRLGPYLHGDVGRYTEKYGGDDKITCARTAAAVAEMMEFMRNRDD